MRGPVVRLLRSACLLAMLLQAVVPWAMVQALAATADPFAHPTICRAFAPDPGQPDDGGSPARSAHGCVCPICHLGGGQPPPLLVETRGMPVPLAAAPLAWPPRSRGDGLPLPPHPLPPSRGPPARSPGPG